MLEKTTASLSLEYYVIFPFGELEIFDLKTKADLPNLHLLILLIFVKSLYDAEELF